ncbi:MAG: uroporphyrinogen decarboxylase family protein [Clostridia bacterium]|nr:uroporphyrinogen decarboxylase family protein [Clostridia bacterium]
MNVRELLWANAGAASTRALPILSFPAIQKMDATVRELVASPELQARAMEIIAHQTQTLAAVSLMDLSVEAEAFGAKVVFSDHEVPTVMGQLVEDEDDAQELEVPPLSAGRAALCVEGVRQAKALITDKPVLAGMIGPYSLAGRLMDVTEIMYTCYDEPETVHAVLEKVTQYLIAYGTAFREAGADGVVMAEPLAGILSPEMAEEFSMPYVKRIFDALKTDSFAVIYHNCGNSVEHMLEGIFALDADAYHFGNASDMEKVLAAAPENALCMGNIDPAGAFVHGTPESMTAAVQDLAARCGRYPNFVLSSGCDIPATASWDNIRAFFDAAADRG